ncbi:MAG: ferrous iron transport protein B [Hadesarchaea archaeon]|jgi:ferrous iron transport protein B|nr:ferrous iron transport protein B [Hadesarchaea archaeon]
MEKRIRIALAGNANVGKSVIFNHLTGLHQHIGNWPGKTVEKAEGTLYFRGRLIDVIDLPGIYSLSTFSLEERISREYIAREKPDVVINVVDASALERNLFFTLQLLELEPKMVVALNQLDMAERRGVKVDPRALEKLLGVPVVPTVAVRGRGMHALLEKALEVAEGKRRRPRRLSYGREIERRVSRLLPLLEGTETGYPPRWLALKLLEGDEEIKRLVKRIRPRAAELAEKYAKELEKLYGEKAPLLLTSRRYSLASRIANGSQRLSPRPSPTGRMDALTTHPVLGYLLLAAVLLSLFLTVFWVGSRVEEALERVTDPLVRAASERFGELAGEGVLGGILAGLTIALPFVLPFYVLLTLLEDTGYLARAAFLMDGLMHRVGVHGKAFIPLLLGYGCNVPACLGCRIMETERERTLSVFLSTLVPCAARTVVILGLVGRFVGIGWAVGLYLLDLLVILLLGRLAYRVLPGEPMGLILEIPPYRRPHLPTVLRGSWERTKDFLYVALPFILGGSLLLTSLRMAGLLDSFSNLLSPLTVGWLGLPAAAGVVLLFGVLRKELTLIMLTLLLGSDLSLHLTPAQMITFATVTMFYFPCVATLAALVREVGWRKSLAIAFSEILFALWLGGVMFRILTLAGL